MYQRSQLSAFVPLNNVCESGNKKVNSHSPLARKMDKPGTVVFTIPASPKRPSTSENEENESPELLLQHFANQTRVDFRKVYINETKTMSLRVKNPCEVDLILSTATNLNPKKGFSADFVCETVPAGGCISITLTWTPKEAGCQRELIYFETNARHKLRVTLIGNAITRAKKQRKIKCVSTSKRPFRQIQASNQENQENRPKHLKVDRALFRADSIDLPIDCSDDFLRRETFLIKNVKPIDQAYKFDAPIEPKAAFISTFSRHTQVCMHGFSCHCDDAARRIQSWYRARLLARKTRQHFLKQKEAAITIQKWYRMQLVEQRMRRARERAVQNLAAFKIQAWFQSALVARAARVQFVRRKQAVRIIQLWYRSCILTRQTREQFVHQKRAAVLIQNWYRVQLEKRRSKEAQEQALKNLAAVKIQLWFRAVVTTREIRMRFVEQKRAAQVIQRWFRKELKERKRKAEEEELQRHCAAVKIQVWYKGCIASRKIRMQYIDQKKAAVAVQRWYRSKLEQRRIREAQERARKNLAAANIQTWYKASIVARKTRREFLESKQAAQTIQRWFRGKLIEQKIKAETLARARNDAAAVIQTWLKSIYAARKARQDYSQLKSAAVVFQKWYRVRLARRQLKLALETKAREEAALKIQTWYRSVIRTRAANAEYSKLKLAAVTIQRVFRRKLEEKRAIESKLRNEAAAKIQKTWRSCIFARTVRNGYLEQKKASIAIQRWFRVVIHKREFRLALEVKAREEAVLKIQSWYRTVVIARQIRAEYESLQRAAITIQRAYRKKMEQKQIEKRREMKLRNDAAVRVQKVWRGFTTRKNEFVKEKRLKDAFETIQKTRSEASDAHLLCNRTSAALEKLLSYKHLNPLTQHLASLAYTTSMSQNCCRTIAQEPNAIKILMKVICDTNRSEPHKLITAYCLSVLLNLAKFDETSKVIFQNQRLPDLLLTYLKMYQKETKIFNKLVTLLWTIAHKNKAIVTTGNLSKISSLNSAIRAEYQRKKLPMNKVNLNVKLEPCWCVRQNSVYEFQDRFVAIATLCEFYRKNV